MINKMRGLGWIAGVGICSLVTACGAAEGGSDSGESFPSDTVSIVVPYAAGGPNDVVARALAPCLAQAVDGTVVVENVEGGGGAIGASQVAQAKPDGHTLGLMPPQGSLVLLPMVQDVGYSFEDFTPIADTYFAPSALFVRSDSPHESFEDLVAAAKAKPNSVTIGNSGAGTVFDLETRHLASAYDVPVKSIPFNGGAEAQAALLGNNVDALYSLADQGRLSAVEAGELRALVTGAPEPVELLPGVPSFAEAGFEDLVNSSATFTLVGPSGLPEGIRGTLTSATTDCLTDEAVVKALGADYIPESPATGNALEDELAKTRDNLTPLVD